MINKRDRLKELRIELDWTYQEMKLILLKNNITRKLVAHLPKKEHEKWNELYQKSMVLINEFIGLLREDINNLK